MAQAVDATKCPMRASPLKQRATSLDLDARNSEVTCIPKKRLRWSLDGFGRLNLENKKNTNLVKTCESSYVAQYLIVFEQITHCKVFGQASSWRFQTRFFCQIESPVPLKSIKDIPDVGNTRVAFGWHIAKYQSRGFQVEQRTRHISSPNLLTCPSATWCSLHPFASVEKCSATFGRTVLLEMALSLRFCILISVSHPESSWLTACQGPFGVALSAVLSCIEPQLLQNFCHDESAWARSAWNRRDTARCRVY